MNHCKKKCNDSLGEIKAIIAIESNYRYDYLIIKALQNGNQKRIDSFVRMGKLTIIKNNQYEEAQEL